nr:immunoglobulin light chain junction region [Macaca mulatta]MPN89588.1 immunoglobulin light chain junction region [Macaca mulatta]
CMQVLQTPQSF